jgi:hypothetical protein
MKTCQAKRYVNAVKLTSYELDWCYETIDEAAIHLKGAMGEPTAEKTAQLYDFQTEITNFEMVTFTLDLNEGFL